MPPAAAPGSRLGRPFRHPAPRHLQCRQPGFEAAGAGRLFAPSRVAIHVPPAQSVPRPGRGARQASPEPPGPAPPSGVPSRRFGGSPAAAARGASCCQCSRRAPRTCTPSPPKGVSRSPPCRPWPRAGACAPFPTLRLPPSARDRGSMSDLSSTCTATGGGRDVVRTAPQRAALFAPVRRRLGRAGERPAAALRHRALGAYPHHIPLTSAAVAPCSLAWLRLRASCGVRPRNCPPLPSPISFLPCPSTGSPRRFGPSGVSADGRRRAGGPDAAAGAHAGRYGAWEDWRHRDQPGDPGDQLLHPAERPGIGPAALRAHAGHKRLSAAVRPVAVRHPGPVPGRPFGAAASGSSPFLCPVPPGLAPELPAVLRAPGRLRGGMVPAPAHPHPAPNLPLLLQRLPLQPDCLPGRDVRRLSGSARRARGRLDRDAGQPPQAPQFGAHLRRLGFWRRRGVPPFPACRPVSQTQSKIR